MRGMQNATRNDLQRRRLDQARGLYPHIRAGLSAHARRRATEVGLVLALRELLEPSRSAAQLQSRTRAAVRSAEGLAVKGSGSGDIAELCFVVLMEATNDQDKDLELILAETKAQTNSKQALRDVISKVGRDVASNVGPQWRQQAVESLECMASRLHRRG